MMDAQQLPQKTELSWWLLAVGVFLLLLPIVIASAEPTVLINAQYYLRIIAAIGGALIGGFVPGTLQITAPGIKGAGALGVFALIYATNPPVIGAGVANPLNPPADSDTATSSSTPKQQLPINSSSTSKRLLNWIYMGTANRATAKINEAHLTSLQTWMNNNSKFANLPPFIFATGNDPVIEQGRQAAVRDLKIP